MTIGKKYCSSFALNLMPLNCNGFLVGVKQTGLAKETALTSVCPTCATPVKVSQFYQCPEGHGPFKMSELDKAKEVTKGTFVRLSKEEIAGIGKSELEPNILDLTVHRAEDVDAQMFASDNAYIFYPNGNSAQYGVLLEMVDLPNLAFVGLCNLQNHEKLLRLSRWGENLVVQTMLYPADLSERETVPIKEDAKFGTFKAAMTQFVETSVTNFDPTAYTNARKAKLLELQAGGTIVTSDSSPVTDSDDVALDKLMELLQQKKGA